MSTLNRCRLIGHVGKQPEVRITKDSFKMFRFSLATNRVWKNAAGDKQQQTHWHRILIMNSKLVDLAEKYLKKGSKVMIEGNLEYQNYTDHSGIDRRSSEIVLRYDGILLLLDKAINPHQSPWPDNVANPNDPVGGESFRYDEYRRTSQGV